MRTRKDSGQGQAIKWIREHTNHEGVDCLWWPFSRQPTGYGHFGYLGDHYYAHRYMCELVNGPAPTPGHEASHTCGKGKAGCVHPKHLEWKTPSGNQLDRREHGTKNDAWWGQRGKLTREQRLQIFALKGHKTQREIAKQFGVTFQNVSHIHRTYEK
jgi:hypothetical protein